MAQAEELVGDWFVKRSVAYRDRKPDPEPEPDARADARARRPSPTPEPPDPTLDEAPCPDRDRPPGDSPAAPCETEEQEFERLGRELLGASTDEVVAALTELAQRRGCASPMRFCMSRYGKALGVCEDQELWRRMCEAMGWIDDPPVLRTVQVTEDRRIYPNGRAPRFMLAVDSLSGEASVRELEAEYEDVPGETLTLYDWHRNYGERCANDKR